MNDFALGLGLKRRLGNSEMGYREVIFCSNATPSPPSKIRPISTENPTIILV